MIRDTKDNTISLANRIRKQVLNITSRSGGSHIGSSFSIADILAVLYGKIMKLDCLRPKWELRDRFILSKGHAGAAVYATLSELGFFSQEKLLSYYQDGSELCGHISHKGVSGVEFSTGSLGHGLSVGAGMAYSGILENKNYKVFVLLSDGECDEGSNWEAILFASHHKLNNLIAIVDYNKLQSITTVDNTLTLEPFVDKWQSFGWAVKEVDGHNHDELTNVFKNLPLVSDKPTCIIAHTIKGKGVSFMENSVLWHYRTARGDEYMNALQELEEAIVQ